MSEKDKAREELRALQADLKEAKLSRRGFLTRVQALGLGFGAAMALGIREADAAVGGQAELRLRSSNQAVDGILEEAREERAQREGEEQVAQIWYARYARWGYARYYGRYGRYGRVYGRYARFYGRYARWYRRW